MDNNEIRLEILRIVVETGSENQKRDPLPICEKYYNWICKANENSPTKRKTIRKNLSADKE
jgi:hypothetical protein